MKFLHQLIEGMLQDHDSKVRLEAELRDRAAQLACALEKQNDVASRVMNAMAELRDPTLSRRGLSLVQTARAGDEATVQ